MAFELTVPVGWLPALNALNLPATDRFMVASPRMLRAVVMTLLLAGMIMGGIPLFQQLTGQFDDNFGGFAQTNERGFRTGEETFEGEVVSEFTGLDTEPTEQEANITAILNGDADIDGVMGTGPLCWRRIASAVCRGRDIELA